MGKGGFGLVFQGKYKGADVAVKEPHDPEALHEEEALKKSFFREAKNLYRLSHRNVVALVGGIVSDDCGDPCYMMVTELLPQSLQKEMEILQELDGEERCKRQDRLMIELAEGLAYLHSAGIIHKDIKSQNVMVDTSGSPKYIDFGLCKQEQVTTSTASTRLAGTLYWMSPERKRGGAASAKSDVYSLGLLLVYMLTMAKLPEGEE
uniref:Protein kinase domain-containing protein n=1 Tax=Guillardia theta (strain CCMP2712) TaxID=905079 RepID=A0A0C3TFI3_GUITC